MGVSASSGIFSQQMASWRRPIPCYENSTFHCHFKAQTECSPGMICVLWIGASRFLKVPIRQASMLPGNLKGISQAWGAFEFTPLSHVGWLSLRVLCEVLWGSPHCEVGNTILLFLITFPRALESKTSHLHSLHLKFYKSQNPWGLIGFYWNVPLLPKIYLL